MLKFGVTINVSR